jgi:hypothetical protein
MKEQTNKEKPQKKRGIIYKNIYKILVLFFCLIDK